MDPYVRLAGLSLMLPPDWLAVLAEVGDGLLDMLIELEFSDVGSPAEPPSRS